MTSETLILISIIAGVILSIASNWLYDILKGRGVFSVQPSSRAIALIILGITPFIILVALPELISSSENTRIIQSSPVSDFPSPTASNILDDLEFLNDLENSTLSLGFSPTGDLIASAYCFQTTGEPNYLCAGGGLTIHSISQGEIIANWEAHDADISGGVFSRSENHYVTSSRDGSVIRWDIRNPKGSGKPIIEGDEPITSIALSPNGDIFVVGYENGSIEFFFANSELEINHLNTVPGPSGEIRNLLFSDSENLLATDWGEGNIRIWEMQTGTPHFQFAVNSTIEDFAFSPDGNYFAAAGWDKSIRVWNLISGNEAHHLLGHADVITSIAFTTDSLSLISTSWDDTTRLWELKSGSGIGSIDISAVTVDISPDGNLLALTQQNGEIGLWEISK